MALSIRYGEGTREASSKLVGVTDDKVQVVSFDNVTTVSEIECIDDEFSFGVPGVRKIECDLKWRRTGDHGGAQYRHWRLVEGASSQGSEYQKDDKR